MLALSLLGWGTRAGSTPSPGPEKESWVVIKETHQVLDKLFPKFLKGNILQAPWPLMPCPQGPFLPPPHPSTWEGVDPGSLCERKSGPQFPRLQDGGLGWALRLSVTVCNASWLKDRK